MLNAMFAVNSKDPEIIPFIVSLFTWGKTYHCELLFADGQALTTDPTNGVHYVEREYDKYHWVAIPLPWIKAKDQKLIRSWADNLVEEQTKYDTWGAVLGGIFKCNDPAAYFCSELLAEAIADVTPPIEKDKWYSPNDLWKILSEHLHYQCPAYRYPHRSRIR